MGNNDAILRRAGDDSDAYVTFDMRSVILDLPDDGRVAVLLPARGGRVGLVRVTPRPAAPRHDS